MAKLGYGICIVLGLWVMATTASVASDSNAITPATTPTVTPSTSAEEAGGGVPIVHIPAVRYEFPSVVEGQEVVHNFVIANRGTAPLIIERVKSG